VVKDGHAAPTRVVEILEASHPVPDQRGVEAGRKLDELLAGADERTLVFCLLSGGGSALLVAPATGISLADKQATTSLLLACGADIAEINAVRKHLSTVKGGGLARLAAPAQVVSLIVSDVVGDRLDVIASGPTVADNSTWGEVGDIFARYALWEQLPAGVAARVRAGLAGQIPDTPKPGDAGLARVRNTVIAGNRQALAAMALEARGLGYAPLILSSTIEGETREVARLHVALAREVLATGHPLAAPCCLISGGETTVTLGQGHGKGGRNQEFALAAALDLRGMEGVLLASVGSDGSDGPTDAAGAWADGETVARAAGLGLKARDFLARHDAYNFFAALGDLVITGPTRTNVMDVRLALIR
jgi:glycerate 2-kinase